jgi:hypothetical protein
VDTYRGAWGLARGEGLFELELTNDDHHDGVVWGRLCWCFWPMQFR